MPSNIPLTPVAALSKIVLIPPVLSANTFTASAMVLLDLDMFLIAVPAVPRTYMVLPVPTILLAPLA